jgi:hypothetical protein
VAALPHVGQVTQEPTVPTAAAIGIPQAGQVNSNVTMGHSRGGESARD